MKDINNNEMFRKVWIKSEADLPKNADSYFSQHGHALPEAIFAYRKFDPDDPQLMAIWLHSIDWYLQPLPAPESSEVTDEKDNKDKTKVYISPSKEQIIAFVNNTWTAFYRHDIVCKIEDSLFNQSQGRGVREEIEKVKINAISRSLSMLTPGELNKIVQIALNVAWEGSGHLLKNKVEWHECRFCHIYTNIPDSECGYKNTPSNSELLKKMEESKESKEEFQLNKLDEWIHLISSPAKANNKKIN
jgi:hypothetical protein